jgi:hypothetical protein
MAILERAWYGGCRVPSRNHEMQTLALKKNLRKEKRPTMRNGWYVVLQLFRRYTIQCNTVPTADQVLVIERHCTAVRQCPTSVGRRRLQAVEEPIAGGFFVCVNVYRPMMVLLFFLSNDVCDGHHCRLWNIRSTEWMSPSPRCLKQVHPTEVAWQSSCHLRPHNATGSTTFRLLNVGSSYVQLLTCPLIQ